MELSLEIDTDEIEQTVSLLAENYSVSINQLEKGSYLYNKYIELKEAITNLYNTSSYSVITESILKQYRPTQIVPGTLGAFLWGCSSHYYGDVNKMCSSLCLNAVPFEDSKKCQYQIWRASPELRKENDVINNRAYIYVNENWGGFTPEEVDILRNNFVEYATIITTKNNKHKILISMIELDFLQTYEKVEENLEEPRSPGRFYLYSFLLISIIIGIGLFYFKNKIYEMKRYF